MNNNDRFQALLTLLMAMPTNQQNALLNEAIPPTTPTGLVLTRQAAAAQLQVLPPTPITNITAQIGSPPAVHNVIVATPGIATIPTPV